MRMFMGSAKISTIASASAIYMAASKGFASRASDLDEPTGLESLDQPQKDVVIAELVRTSLAAVLVANSAVEAIVNELFLESSVVSPGHWFNGIPGDVSRSLFDAWEHGAERYEVVTKCQIAAALTGKKRLDFGSGSFQKMKDLIALRNELVHHKPISVEHGKPQHESDDAIERRLCRNFERSRVCASYAYRWYGCLGAGCANWAYETAVAFQSDFFGHLSVGYPKPA